MITYPHCFQHYACFLGFTILLLCEPAWGKLPDATPEEVGLRSERLERIDALVQAGLEQNLMPGCVVMVGRKGHIAFHKAYGHRQLEPTRISMTTDTVFDMASITKPMATATSVMVLLEEGRIRLRDKVAKYIPEFSNAGKESITVQQLLTHQAGFVPDNAIADYEQGRKRAFENIYKLKTIYEPGTRFVYSDVGFILLDDLIERQSGLAVDAFARERIFAPLGMRETGFLPAPPLQARAAVTEQREDRWMRGEVHDPRAYLMRGVAGHAGLFSTSEDIAIYAQMLLNGGQLNQTRILSQPTVELMTDSYRIVEGEKVSVRGLGWDKLSGYSSNRGENMSARAFGHGGFTGTVLWIDPDRQLFFIFLSNRVHPDGTGSVNHLAGQIATVAVSAIDDELLKRPGDHDRNEVAGRRGTGTSAVKLGIDLLAESQFSLLAGQRVGLITNQTGVASNGISTIKLLKDSSAVQLRALFSPEHGLAGMLDQTVIGDTVDDGTGLKVFSLYGKTRTPSAAQLAEIDTLVFDIQDIGCRFYTYISTMGMAMRAAAEHAKRFVVLDRPNPIGGVAVTGPTSDAGTESFVNFHQMPLRHGMTVGELAKMFKEEMELTQLDLLIVPCHGWHRTEFFDATGLSWINPSPNMRNLNQAILYPGIGLWETTNLSVGRGTDTPFEVLGAPWIDARELAFALNGLAVEGVRFMPRTFTPTSSKYAMQQCQGIQISITNRDTFEPVRCGFAVGCELRRLYPDQWEIDKAMRLLCNQKTLDAVKSACSLDEIMASVRRDAEAFQLRRAKFLLY